MFCLVNCIALGLSFLMRGNHIPEVNIAHFIDNIFKSINSTCKNRQFLHQKSAILFFWLPADGKSQIFCCCCCFLTLCDITHRFRGLQEDFEKNIYSSSLIKLFLPIPSNINLPIKKFLLINWCSIYFYLQFAIWFSIYKRK